MKFYHLYVLELQQDKYYVGISKNVDERVEQHLSGCGADWTKKYRPEKVVYTENTQLVNKKEAEHLENIVTLQWMIVKGIENVRGGDFCAVQQSDVKALLQKEFIDYIYIFHNNPNMNLQRAYAIAKDIYEKSELAKQKQDVIVEQIRMRNVEKRAAWCSVEMCIHNKCRKCSLGISPYDRLICEKNYRPK